MKLATCHFLEEHLQAITIVLSSETHSKKQSTICIMHSPYGPQSGSVCHKCHVHPEHKWSMVWTVFQHTQQKTDKNIP